MATKKEEEEQDETPSKWADYEDLFEDEDDSVVASAKARHLAGAMRKRSEDIAKGKYKRKKPSSGSGKPTGWL
jgi:hypothetical protein